MKQSDWCSRIVAGWLILSQIFLPSSAGACPELSRRALRSESTQESLILKKLRAGLEEESYYQTLLNKAKPGIEPVPGSKIKRTSGDFQTKDGLIRVSYFDPHGRRGGLWIDVFDPQTGEILFSAHEKVHPYRSKTSHTGWSGARGLDIRIGGITLGPGVERWLIGRKDKDLKTPVVQGISYDPSSKIFAVRLDPAAEWIEGASQSTFKIKVPVSKKRSELVTIQLVMGTSGGSPSVGLEEETLTGPAQIFQEGHLQGIERVDFVSQNQLLSVSMDGEVRSRYLSSGQSGVFLKAPFSYGINLMSRDPKGRFLALASSVENTIWLWDQENGQGKELVDSVPHTVITSIAFHPNGKILASGGRRGEIWLWDVKTDEPIEMLAGHTDWVTGLAFHPNGKMLVSASHDGTLRFWNLKGEELREKLFAKVGAVWSIAISPDGKTLAYGGADGSIRLRQMTNGKTVELSEGLTLKGHKDWVQNLSFSPNGKRLASSAGSSDKTIRIWEVASGGLLGILPMGGWIRSLAFQPDGKMLAASVQLNNNDSIQLWDLEKLPAAPKPAGPESPTKKPFSSVQHTLESLIHQAERLKLELTLKEAEAILALAKDRYPGASPVTAAFAMKRHKLPLQRALEAAHLAAVEKVQLPVILRVKSALLERKLAPSETKAWEMVPRVVHLYQARGSREAPLPLLMEALKVVGSLDLLEKIFLKVIWVEPIQSHEKVSAHVYRWRLSRLVRLVKDGRQGDKLLSVQTARKILGFGQESSKDNVGLEEIPEPKGEETVGGYLERLGDELLYKNPLGGRRTDAVELVLFGEISLRYPFKAGYAPRLPLSVKGVLEEAGILNRPALGSIRPVSEGWMTGEGKTVLQVELQVSPFRLQIFRDVDSGLEEGTAALVAKIQLHMEMEKPLQVTVREVRQDGSGAVVRYEEEGNWIDGFLPVSFLFDDPQRRLSIEAKMEWLIARGSNPLWVIPEKFVPSLERPSVPRPIFYLKMPITPRVLTGRVFRAELFHRKYYGEVENLLSRLLEIGGDPWNEILSFFNDEDWWKAQPAQRQEIIRWLARQMRDVGDSLKPALLEALFELFEETTRSSRERGTARTWAAQGMVSVAVQLDEPELKSRALQEIQQLWEESFQWRKDAPEATKAMSYQQEKQIYLIDIAGWLDTPEADAWLERLPSRMTGKQSLDVLPKLFPTGWRAYGRSLARRINHHGKGRFQVQMYENGRVRQVSLKGGAILYDSKADSAPFWLAGYDEKGGLLLVSTSPFTSFYFIRPDGNPVYIEPASVTVENAHETVRKLTYVILDAGGVTDITLLPDGGSLPPAAALGRGVKLRLANGQGTLQLWAKEDRWILFRIHSSPVPTGLEEKGRNLLVFPAEKTHRTIEQIGQFLERFYVYFQYPDLSPVHELYELLKVLSRAGEMTQIERAEFAGLLRTISHVRLTVLGDALSGEEMLRPYLGSLLQRMEETWLITPPEADGLKELFGALAQAVQKEWNVSQPIQDILNFPIGTFRWKPRMEGWIRIQGDDHPLIYTVSLIIFDAAISLGTPPEERQPGHPLGQLRFTLVPPTAFQRGAIQIGDSTGSVFLRGVNALDFVFTKKGEIDLFLNPSGTELMIRTGMGEYHLSISGDWKTQAFSLTGPSTAGMEERRPRNNEAEFGAGREPVSAPEVKAARERVEEIVRRWKERSADSYGRQVVVMGPSIHQVQMPFLGELIERTLGPVSEQIFLDPADSEERIEKRADWAERIYERYPAELPSVLFLGSDEEFKRFQAFLKGTLFRDPQHRADWSRDPGEFVVQLLQWLGLPLDNLSEFQRQQLRDGLELLIQA